MKKQELQETIEWLQGRLELLNSSNPPSFPTEQKMLTRILIYMMNNLEVGK